MVTTNKGIFKHTYLETFIIRDLKLINELPLEILVIYRESQNTTNICEKCSKIAQNITILD